MSISKGTTGIIPFIDGGFGEYEAVSRRNVRKAEIALIEQT